MSRIFTSILSVFFVFDSSISSNAADGKKENQLCMVTRVQNEAYMLPQWIEYHRYLGISKFIIANDCSSEDAISIIGYLYQELGVAMFYEPNTLLSKRGNRIIPQCTKAREPREGVTINWLIKIAKPICNWIVVIDMDEYIAHKSLTTASEGMLSDYFSLHGSADNKKNKNSSSLVLPSVYRFRSMFMSAHGRIHKPKGLVIENYVNGAMSDMIKSMARSDVVIHWWTPHAPSVLTYYNPYDISCESFDNETRLNPTSGCKEPVNDWFTHHYAIRSWDEYSRGRASRLRNAGGGLNVEYPNNFTIWKEMAHVSSECNNLGKEFSASMVPLVYQRLQETATAYCTHRPSVCRGRVTPAIIFDALLSGNFSRVIRLHADKWALFPQKWATVSTNVDLLPQ